MDGGGGIKGGEGETGDVNDMQNIERVATSQLPVSHLNLQIMRSREDNPPETEYQRPEVFEGKAGIPCVQEAARKGRRWRSDQAMHMTD